MCSRRTLKRRNQRKKMTICNSLNYSWNNINSRWEVEYLGNKPAEATTPTEPAQKKGKPMCYDCDFESQPTVENRKLTYFQNRVDGLTYLKRQDLRKQFNLDTPEAPTNAEELVKAIQDGNFHIEPKTRDQYYFSPLARIIWRKEDIKADFIGFEAATKELDKLTRKTTDLVTAGDAAQQLSAIEALEAWSYTS